MHKKSKRPKDRQPKDSSRPNTIHFTSQDGKRVIGRTTTFVTPTLREQFKDRVKE